MKELLELFNSYFKGSAEAKIIMGRPEIQKFQSAVRAEKKDKGYFFAFSFSKPAYEEVARCKQEEGINIELLPVLDLMNLDPTPSIL